MEPSPHPIFLSYSVFPGGVSMNLFLGALFESPAKESKVDPLSFV